MGEGEQHEANQMVFYSSCCRAPSNQITTRVDPGPCKYNGPTRQIHH